MELWNEYEGRTIAGFPLQQLLRPEGRSAFFSTTTESGEPTVVRLIESHYDEDEILARWQAVKALDCPALLAMVRFDRTVMDETALVYTVMEPTDADLGQILQQRPLNAVETHQVATSVVAALLALRSVGMVHEHILAMNVLAVGETVKLRSDCVRYAPEGSAGEAAATRDVHDLCHLLLQALTLKRTLEKTATYSAALPAPFREIVANGLEGRWGLNEIAAALARSTPAAPAAGSSAKPSTAAAAAESARGGDATSAQPEVKANQAEQRVASPASAEADSSTAGRASRTEPVAGRAVSAPAVLPVRSLASEAGGISAAVPIKSAATPPVAPTSSAAPMAPTAPMAPMFNPAQSRRTVHEPIPRDPRMLRATIAAIIVFVLFIVAWRMTRHTSSPARAVQSDSGASPTVSMPAPSGVSAVDRATQAQPQTLQQSQTTNTAVGSQPSGLPWRVVAFTYNKQAQAQAKAGTLSRQHSDLKIEVFTPTGRAPYLVTVGGSMNRAEAMALKSRLRGRGFPRDLYAQNYGTRTVEHPRGRHQR